MLIFDLETGPRPDDELKLVCEPFDPATVAVPTGDYPTFDPSAVKLGNTKDATKVAAKIEEARGAHEAGRTQFEADRANGPALIAQAEQEYWDAIRDKAALSPVTGQILAIGCYGTEQKKAAIAGIDSVEDEKAAISDFFTKFAKCRTNNRLMVGFNSNAFDLPFLVKRAWLLGVDVPGELQSVDGRYFDRVFVDLLARWKCGVNGGNGGGNGSSITLDGLARFFGVGGKTDGVCGKDFARLWKEDREKATAYLVNDLVITAECASRMGFV